MADTRIVDLQSLLLWARGRYQKLVLVASFQAESSVLIDAVARLELDIPVLTLDTGRLPQETHELIDAVRDRYGVRIEVVGPDPGEVGEMTASHGTNLFFRSQELRMRCCEVRKARPLARALNGYDAWITGLRRQQSPTRSATQLISVDRRHGGIAKIAPLAAWSSTQVWDYIGSEDLPYNRLYDLGYTSIGCAPCTRATLPGEAERAGRWFWEGAGGQGPAKECGLHWDHQGRLALRAGAGSIAH